MDPITLLLLLGGGGSIAYSLLKKKAAPKQNLVNVSLSNPSALPAGGLSVSNNPFAANSAATKATTTGLQAVLKIAGQGAGYAAAVTGGGAIGGLITGDIGGTIAGSLSATAGNVGNVGRTLGKEIDKFLGGDGKSGTGIVFQSVGFVGGLAVGVFGLMALPLFGQVMALVVAIGAAISDNARLAYGQQGATLDAKAAAQQFFDTTLPQLRASVMKGFSVGQLTPEDEWRVRCFCLAYTIGFTNEENQAKYRVHMAKSKGVFVADHRQWAVDRGVFVDDMRPVINGLYFLTSPVQMPKMPASGNGLGPLQFAMWLASKDGRAYGQAVSAVAQAGRNLYSSFIGANNADAWHCQDRGRFLSNLMHYLQSMSETYGIGVGPKEHAEFWRDIIKSFTGQIDAKGNLIDGGYIVDWNASLANGAPAMQALS